MDGHSYLLLHLQLWEKWRRQLTIRHIKGDHTERNHRLLAMLFTGYPLQPEGKALLLKELSNQTWRNLAGPQLEAIPY